MKRIHLLFIVLFSLLIVGCETDVELNDTYKPNSFVFGLLDQNADTQYVRVNKAFLGDGSAEEMASSADLINYNTGDIKVEIVDQLNNDTILLSTISKSKSVGYFNNADHIVYYTTEPLLYDVNNKIVDYKLIVTNLLNGEIITGETQLIDNIKLVNPRSFVGQRSNMSFTRTCQTEEVACFLSTYSIEWFPSTNSENHEGTLRFIYDEINTTTNDTTEKYYDYNIGSVANNINEGSASTLAINFSPELFYTALGANIPTPSNNVVRIEPRIEILISISDEDFSLYINAVKPSNDVNQNRLGYSNLSNGLGLFSARNFINVVSGQERLYLTTQSSQKLRESNLTKHLKFKAI